MTQNCSGSAPAPRCAACHLIPLEDLGLVDNCQCAALVYRHGAVVWSCRPRFDSRPFLARCSTTSPADASALPSRTSARAPSATFRTRTWSRPASRPRRVRSACWTSPRVSSGNSEAFDRASSYGSWSRCPVRRGSGWSAIPCSAGPRTVRAGMTAPLTSRSPGTTPSCGSPRTFRGLTSRASPSR